MANKRMFSIDVTETDSFLEMPLTAQALYFHLGMRGDDDGFVSNPHSIMRVTGCCESDLNVLVESGYIITFRSGVIVISDWKVNNYLRGDRYKRYVLADDNQPSTIGISTGNQVTTQYRIEENRAVVDKATTAAAASRLDTALSEIVQHYEKTLGTFPRSALDKLKRWQEVYSTELICKAFDEAAENNVRKWRYVDGILKGWQADGVRTLSDVEARRDARKKAAQPPEKKLEVLH